MNASRIILWLGPLIAAGLLIGAVRPAAAAQDCSAAGIAQTRRDFKQAYDQKDYDRADALMTALWNECVVDPATSRSKDIDPVLRAWLDNDTAILAHRRGDDEGCLQALMDYIPPTKHPSPALAKLPPDLQRAINFNYRLCKPYCGRAGPSAACESINATAQLGKMVESGFAERPCPFDTGGSPTLALPDGNCLTVFAAAPWRYAEGEEGDLQHQDPDTVCPRVSLARLENGKLALTPLAVPKQSMLRSIDVCCQAINLAINAVGHIELVPSENPPENCLSGHRWNAQQDIFVLQGGKLTLIHRLAFQ